MNTIRDIYKEFIILSDYTSNSMLSLKDINLGDCVLLRIDHTTQLIYLTNGTTITFSKKMVDIFTSLNVYGGNMVLNKRALDKVENFIYTFIQFLHYINTSKYDKVIDIITKLCNIGSKEFIKWNKETFGISISPIEFSSLDKFITV